MYSLKDLHSQKDKMLTAIVNAKSSSEQLLMKHTWKDKLYTITKEIRKRMKKTIEIITHANTFHADELLAIATFTHFMNKDDVCEINVVRMNSVTPTMLENPELYIFDLGGEYNELLGNFDHHQDKSLPASNILVLDYFCQDVDLASLLKNKLFKYVSDVDTGKIIAREGADLAGFNSIIRNLNNVENGFQIALDMTKQILAGYIATAKLAIETKSYWHSLERTYDATIVIEKAGQFIPEWKEYAEKEGVLLMISENSRGGFQVVSRDSTVISIPVSEYQSYRHNSGFMAVYPYFHLALEHAQEIVKYYIDSRTPKIS